MYVGSPDPIEQYLFELDGEAIVERKRTFAPALLTLAREFLANASDAIAKGKLAGQTGQSLSTSTPRN